ncbi:AAA family ATPase [Nocardia sp. NBC_00565]|uniref:BTAD domain-containing putative transcriptional regulator n=1 Tax=Nocardia sp. NBC_00565 TaxID=2975993 RepID=UPI002E81F468|nr:BTAD domain-containing putative transcriptional regulator [Nocardia sp. NBC_00565]WUC00398.1 AAA family ATPase [Nocardia sp. NBC_00565]
MGIAFGVLGPVWAEDERGRLPLKGPRHRAVLARLLVARGRVVPVAHLVDDLWERPPADAVGAIQTFVAALRRVLEPDRKPREPARVLVTEPPGYAIRAASEQVDAWRFEAAVGRVDELLAAGRAADALGEVDAALELWQGPAYAEFAETGWARAEITRLDEHRSLASEQRARALLALRRHGDAVRTLDSHLGAHPLREQAWQLMVLALYRSGRQSEALAALRRVRRNLRMELGVDPGPELRRLEAGILSHAPHLMPGDDTTGTDSAVIARRSTLARPFVGRADELARLRSAADECAAGGRSGIVLISGTEGVGKSALAEEFSMLMAEQGWTTAWGPSPVDRGTPSNWPWTRILAGLAAAGYPQGPDVAQPEADPAVARFRAHRAAAEYLAVVARDRPVLLVFDDLHQAAEETVDLLSTLATAPVDGSVLLIGTYRATEVGTALTAALARLARAEPTRIYLSGLTETETLGLVRELAGEQVDIAVFRRIHQRSNGNPFFVREITRLLRDEGAASLDAVPVGVRDIVRHRLAGLSRAERTVLQQAAVVGGDIDRDLLIGLVGAQEPVLDAIEAGVRAGFLTESGSSGVRFEHAVVRDVLYLDIAAPRRAAWHAAVGELLEQAEVSDPAVLAYHFLRADSRATAGRAARYARLAALAAERVFAPHEAARLWRATITAHDRAGDNDVRGRLDATMGLVRALAVTGKLAEARTLRAQAITTAEALADPALTARVISAFDVPALWTDNDDPDLAERVVRAAERTLAALPAGELEVRSRLLTTIALELRATDDKRGRVAATEAEAIARQLDNPALLAFALNGRFMSTFERAGLAPERAQLAAELIDLAAAHNLVTFEVLGHLIGIQSDCAIADFAAADHHASAADRLAEQYDLPLVPIFTHWYAALRDSHSGTFEDAEAAYRAAAADLRGAAMPGLEDGILPLALLCLRLRYGCSIDSTPSDFGPHEPWVRPLVLLAQNRPDDARQALRTAPESPHDLLLELRLCLIARAAIALDDKPTMRRVHHQLLPAARELAGATTGLLTLEPVAHYLAQLATALRR